MKFYLFTLLVATPVILFSSCKCDGCDQEYHTSGAVLALSTSHDTESITKDIAIVRTITKQEGDRNCLNKDLVICPYDDILLEQLSIRCNKDLDLENQQVPAGVDLLKEKNLHIYTTTSQKLPVIRLTPTVNFTKGTYLFYLNGSTKEGKPIEDTLKIDWL